MQEGTLINECIAGNRLAQEKLYNFYAGRMKGICMRYARSAFEADDIFQEAFIKVFTNLKNFKMNGSFDGWIRRIVVNTAIDQYKKNLVHQNHVQYETVSDRDLSIASFDHQLHEEDLLKILEKLPHGYKVVFNLYAIEGYSHKEIAEMLNITEGTSKSQLSKARRFVQNLLPQTELKDNGTGEI